MPGIAQFFLIAVLVAVSILIFWVIIRSAVESAIVRAASRVDRGTADRAASSALPQRRPE